MYRAFMKRYGWRYAPGVVFLVASAYLQSLSPTILGRAFDILEQDITNAEAVLWNALYLVMIAAGMLLTRYVWRLMIIGNARNLECHLRRELFCHLQRMAPEFYNTRKTGDLMAYAVNDIGAIRQTFGPGLAMSLNGIVLGALSINSMVTDINPQLALLALSPIPLILLLLVFLGREVRIRFTRVQRTFAEVTDRVGENMGGIRVIKAYVQEEGEVKRFEELNERMKKAGVSMVRVSALLNPLIQMLFGVSFAIGLVYGALLVRDHVISIGEFVAFNGFLTIIMMPVLSIGRIINVFQRGRASQRRLREIMKVPPALHEGHASLSQPVRGELEVRNLTFQYPGTDEPALQDLSFHLQPGQTLGIIGHTGSGKSSIASALLKLYNIPDGTVFLDGVDINTLTLQQLREPYGCVPQDGFLFSTTIADNIDFFTRDVEQPQIEQAAQMACVHEDIMQFPGQYQTLLGDRGVNLSGGQKQRIAIARALLKQPPIYLFDDALAAVDTRTEEMILGNLQQAMQGHTSILIAHRASVVRHADEILVLEHGRVIERGTHEQLLLAQGAYYKLWQMQSGEEVEDENE